MLAVLVGLAACSSEKERAYALPDKLCGAPVDPATLAPLLPGGDKVRQRPDPGSVEYRCWIDVDDKLALSTGALWEGIDDTPRQVAQWEQGVNASDTHEGDDIIYGRTGALARVECPAAKKYDVMYVTLQVVDRKVDKKDTLAFIRSYAKGIRQTERCAGKQQ